MLLLVVKPSFLLILIGQCSKRLRFLFIFKPFFKKCYLKYLEAGISNKRFPLRVFHNVHLVFSIKNLCI